MNIKTPEEIAANAAHALAEAAKQQAVLAALPDEPSLICIHDKFASAIWQNAPLDKALDLIQSFADRGQIVECSHWKDGWVSTWPEAINDYAKRENATLEGSSVVELKLHSFGSRGEYKRAELRAWVRLDVGLVEVQFEIQPDWKWLPEEHATYTRNGEVNTYTVRPKFLGEDIRRKHWSPPGCFQFCYYWADMHNFNASGPQRVAEKGAVSA